MVVSLDSLAHTLTDIKALRGTTIPFLVYNIAYFAFGGKAPSTFYAVYTVS
jgi:hypothetical protein